MSAETIRAEVIGYPENQDEDTFLRMFERDKKQLRACGLMLEVVDLEGVPGYRLDGDASYAGEVRLTGAEHAVLRAVAAALASDPGFPFGTDLAIAVAKLGGTQDEGGGRSASARGALTDETPDVQGAMAAVLAEAVASRKRVDFGYTNATGDTRDREVEPYGVFFQDGRWYLVGRDMARDEARTFAVRRMRDVRANPRRPGSPDFDAPADFSVAEHMLLPFQYGPAAIECELRFSAEDAWRAPRLIGGQGTLEMLPDGGARWVVKAASLPRLARWIVENGPGVMPVAPPELRATLADGLRKVVARHGA